MLTKCYNDIDIRKFIYIFSNICLYLFNILFMMHVKLIVCINIVKTNWRLFNVHSLQDWLETAGNTSLLLACIFHERGKLKEVMFRKKQELYCFILYQWFSALQARTILSLLAWLHGVKLMKLSRTCQPTPKSFISFKFQLVTLNYMLGLNLTNEKAFY